MQNLIYQKKNFSALPAYQALFLWIVLAVFYIYQPAHLFAQTQKDSVIAVSPSTTAAQEFQRIRGLEKDKKDSTAPLRTAANVLLFAPRTFAAGLLFIPSLGSRIIDAGLFLGNYDYLFYFYQKKIGWYPVFDISTGSSLAYGATLFYHNKPFGFSVGGYYANNTIWKAKAKMSDSFQIGHAFLKAELSGSVLSRDDYKFHGFGSNPQNDPRNFFKTNANGDFGVFLQRLSRIQLLLGLHPSPKWKLAYTGFYQERRIENPLDTASDNIDNIFDLSTFPGIQSGRPTIGKQVYNELSLYYDSRSNHDQIQPGFVIDGYAGLSEGVGSDDSRFTRAGGSAALFIPLIKRNRLIVPSVVLDVVDNRNDDVPLSFADYPRQPTFRGVSSKRLLRTDEISMVSSLEYQWPLAHVVGGHLFVDYLFVGNSFDKLTFHEAPYAVGFSFDIHNDFAELARFNFSGGSEGFRFKLTVGLPGYSHSRSDWQ